MTGRGKASRTHIWLESLGEWAWPGRAAPAEVLPPPWVPAVPPRLQYALAGAGAPGPQVAAPVTRRRRLLLASLIAGLVGVCGALALQGRVTIEAITGGQAPSPAVSAPRPVALPAPGPPLPRLVPVRREPTGSVIARASFASAALAGRGAFLVYLPPGYATGTPARFPVLYLLHGRNGHAAAFLEVGIQRTLDHLIRSGAIAPMIAVMVQDLGGLHNWQDIGLRHSASYVVEVQELIDRMLPTIAARSGRAIAGSSMGGFGAMHVALANPERFSVVESWLGFFDGLDGELRAASPLLASLGLHAFLYGAEADPVALPQEDTSFAAALRAAGAQAEGVIYPGSHSLEKVQEHLDAGLRFAGRSLVEAQREEAIAQAHARWRG